MVFSSNIADENKGYGILLELTIVFYETFEEYTITLVFV
jgi:hypothetical protein